MSRTFTVTLGDNGDIEQVESGTAKVEVIQPHPFPPGRTTAATGIGIVMTQENPTCCYWIQGGRAFKICW
jgi:hypothetical protein